MQQEDRPKADLRKLMGRRRGNDSGRRTVERADSELLDDYSTVSTVRRQLRLGPKLNRGAVEPGLRPR